MLKIFLSLFILLSLGSISAQTYRAKLSSSLHLEQKISQNKDTIKILAVMTSFQEDRDEATFGNGKFGSIYSKDYGLSIIDPLPHNKEYFEAHLQFVKNYFSSVSNGKVNVLFHVLPDTFSVSKTMRNYSPPDNSNDFTALADFSKEVWTKASEIYPDFDFKDYDIFLIFHAGVGRDITLPGSVGSQKDLPSVYLSPETLKKIYGQDFTGFPVSNSVYNITNSMIIPETESRELSSLNGNVLFEISINGLLVSSVASYMGLPDLFDTETGKSAIGRFGLMDGQAIFAYNGLFPPVPSAWEKIYLGWEEPVTISPGNFNIDLFSKLAAAGNDTTILKVPINSSEYYLLENRERDVHKDGAIIKYISGGDTLTKSFPKDTSGFFSFETDSISGVVIDVDEYDWALPGNGIVIWHIDDNIINSKIAENKINTDQFHRGVDVVEADGIQDIGEQFQDIFGDLVIGEGAPEDFWYASNPSKFYKNRFGKDTKPSSTTNSGANSLITISDFSNISNKMSCRISYGDSLIAPIFSRNLNLPSSTNKLTGSSSGFALLNNSNLLLINGIGEIINTINDFSDFKTAAVNFKNINYFIGVKGSKLNLYLSDNLNQKTISVDVGEEITSPPVIKASSNADPLILIGTFYGKVFSYSLGNFSSDPSKVDSFAADTSFMVKKIAADGDYISFIGQSKYLSVNVLNKSNQTNYFRLFSNDGSTFEFLNQQITDYNLTKNIDGDEINILLNSSNHFYIIKKGTLQNQFAVNSSSQINSFSLADLKQDGENYIVFTNGNKLEVRNLIGISSENFPYEDPSGIGFEGTPLTADFSGNKNSELIASTKDGRIFAIDGGTGKVVDGFPISAGTELTSTSSLFIDDGKISIAAINNQNNFSSWNIGADAGNIFWSEENGNSFNSSFIGSALNSSYVNEFFPKNKAYNYPNPVYGTQTNIHYYVGEDSKINIKIFDLAGDFVAELNDAAKGGLDNETVWNVNDIQSGVYLARIEAVGSSGKTETNIIKIAIIK